MRTQKTLSLRTSPLSWCGNPPVERNQVTITTKNRGELHPFWCFSVHFPTNRGIATTSVRTGLAMTGNFDTQRQTPIFALQPTAEGSVKHTNFLVAEKTRGFRLEAPGKIA